MHESADACVVTLLRATEKRGLPFMFCAKWRTRESINIFFFGGGAFAITDATAQASGRIIFKAHGKLQWKSLPQLHKLALLKILYI